MFLPKAQLHLSACKLHTTHNSSIRSDERLRLGTSALETLYGGHFALSTLLIKMIFVIPHPPQHHSFSRNLPRLFNCYHGDEQQYSELVKTCDETFPKEKFLLFFHFAGRTKGRDDSFFREMKSRI